jgi:hypothetical protein
MIFIYSRNPECIYMLHLAAENKNYVLKMDSEIGKMCFFME